MKRPLALTVGLDKIAIGLDKMATGLDFYINSSK